MDDSYDALKVFAFWRSIHLHEVHVLYTVEAGGLYEQGSGRPADVLVCPSTHDTPKFQALDVGISCPTTKTALSNQAAVKALAAADSYAKTKTQNHLDRADLSTLDFDVVPLVFESSGAMGTRTQKWWKEMKILDRKINAGPEGGVSPILGPDQYSWAAQRFPEFWSQRLSFTLASQLAELVSAMTSRCLKGVH